jgi:hypothetical protein
LAKLAIVATIKTVPGKRDEFDILVPQEKPTRSCCMRSMPAQRPSMRIGMARPSNDPNETLEAYAEFGGVDDRLHVGDCMR